MRISDARMMMFHVTTEMRQRRSHAQDVGERAAQGGVVNNQTKERRLSDHELRYHVHSGALQKKPRGRPSASQASRAPSYSARTRRSNTTNAYSNTPMAST